MKFGHHSGSHAYGINLEEQNKIINDMSHFIEKMRVGQRSTLLPFQKGILICNKSLKEMLPYIQEKYSSETFQVEYLLTSRLNQDILENFFSYLRSMGAGYDHPTPVELQHRLKWYILGKHSGHAISPGENTEGDNSSIPLIDIEDTRVDFVNATCSQFLSDEDQIMAEEDLFIHMTGPEEINADKTEEEEEKRDDNNVEQEEGKGTKNFFKFCNYFVVDIIKYILHNTFPFFIAIETIFIIDYICVYYVFTNYNGNS